MEPNQLLANFPTCPCCNYPIEPHYTKQFWSCKSNCGFSAKCWLFNAKSKYPQFFMIERIFPKFSIQYFINSNTLEMRALNKINDCLYPSHKIISRPIEQLTAFNLLKSPNNLELSSII